MNKYLNIILAFWCVFLTILCVFRCKNRNNVQEKECVRDTVVVYATDTVFRTDTIIVTKPVLSYVQVTDTMYVKDTVLLCEHKVYGDSLYTAWVSGYNASLDSIYVYNRTQYVTNTITKTIEIKKRKPWGLGIQAGASYPGGFHFGVGISYNILTW